MTETVFRTSSPPPVSTQPTIEPPKNDRGASFNESDLEPVDLREQSTGVDVVLEALGIDDSISSMPDEDKSNAQDVKKYVTDIMTAKGLLNNFANFQKTLGEIRGEMGLDEGADPTIVLDRIGGVVKAWKNLSFIKNSQEKRSIFMKLARQPDSKSMNKLVFEEMEKRSVWQ